MAQASVGSQHPSTDASSLDLPAFSALEPSAVLDAVEAAGFSVDGRLQQLNSYENRVYQVFLVDGSSVVAKFYRPGRWTDAAILEEHAFARELADDEVPVVAPLTLLCRAPVAGWQAIPEGHATLLAEITTPAPGTHRQRLGVWPRQIGRTPDLESLDQLERMGRLIGRMHGCAKRGVFQHRSTLNIDHVRSQLVKPALARMIAGGQGAQRWLSAAFDALGIADAIWQSAGPIHTLRAHGDCHPGNVLWDECLGPFFVDLDDCCMAPAIQDLWMLAGALENGRSPALRALLDGYSDFQDFNPAELRLIEPLRTLRIVKHAAWLAERWPDPAFPAAFPFFGTEAYWVEQTQQLVEQIELMERLR